MLGHPTLVARDVGGDAQREALLAEQRVAAVAAAVTPDLASLGEVDDVLLVIARPRNILLAGRERSPDGMHAGHNPLLVLINLCEDRGADTSHDAHVHNSVGAIGQLNANLRHRAADGAHRVGKNIHGAAAHAAAEELLELLPHDERVLPVVGGASRVLGQRADEGAVLNPGNVVRRGAGKEAARPQLLVEFGESACLDQLVAEEVVLGLRAVDPVDAIGLCEIGHLLNPAD
jgi:hypothetical protein